MKKTHLLPDSNAKNRLSASAATPEMVRESLQRARKAESASLAKSDFLANMSHEIRTPLNAVLGMIELALETDLTAQQQEYLSLMKTAGHSLLTVVNGILDFSRIEAGQLELESIPFSVRECIAETLKMLSFEARKKGLTLTGEIAPGVPDIMLGDPLRLRQIIVNLVGNAIKFSPRGNIAVRASLQAGDDNEACCYFSVSDQGIGIPADKWASIFSPYRQGDRSICRGYGGSGLGLPISARLIDLMGGKIWLDSTPGRGSTFHFTACFGRARPADNCLSPGPGPAAPIPAAPPEKLNILLVEDNPTNRRLGQITLEKAGHCVMLADSGATARTWLKRERPDVILMDVQMPDMDGLQTAAAIRRQEALKGGHVPIIALTARALPSDRERCLLAGMDEYLAKPVEPAALLEAIGKIASRRAAIRKPACRSVVLDQEALLLRINGDLHLLGEIRDLFLRDCGKLMDSLRHALASHDASRFAHAVHTLRGMFRSLAAPAAQETAGRLEDMGIAGEQAEATYHQLEDDVKLLENALLGMVREKAKAAGPAGSGRNAGSQDHERKPVWHVVKSTLNHLWKGVGRETVGEGAARGIERAISKGEAR